MAYLVGISGTERASGGAYPGEDAVRFIRPLAFPDRVHLGTLVEDMGGPLHHGVSALSGRTTPWRLKVSGS